MPETTQTETEAPATLSLSLSEALGRQPVPLPTYTFHNRLGHTLTVQMPQPSLVEIVEFQEAQARIESGRLGESPEAIRELLNLMWGVVEARAPGLTYEDFKRFYRAVDLAEMTRQMGIMVSGQVPDPNALPSPQTPTGG